LGIGTLTISLLVFSLVYTFNNALLTLVSQAYGQHDFKLCARYLNRQIYLNLAIFLLLSLALFFLAEPLFLSLDLSPQVAARSASYVRIVLPGHMFLTISNCYQKYLSAQREVRMQMWANVIALGCYMPIAWLMIGRGIEGIAVSMSVNYVMRWATLQGMIHWSRFKDQLIPLSKKSCRKNLWPQLRLGLKSVSMGIWQYWSYQMFTVIVIIMMPTEIIAA
jgi:Na+-driven multidrug efflux pump